MQHTVIFTPEALEQVSSLYRYIAIAASPGIAERYTGAIVTFCEGLRDIPLVGILRDDLRPGLRITNFKKRAVIAYAVGKGRVSIIGIFYGGQDYEAAMQDDTEL